jgi:hypothetical protein
MNLKRWWCAVTAHKWHRERREGTDLLTCRRCGYSTDLQSESEANRNREGGPQF